MQKDNKVTMIPFGGDLDRIASIIKYYGDMSMMSRKETALSLKSAQPGLFKEGALDLINQSSLSHDTQKKYWQGIFEDILKKEIERVALANLPGPTTAIVENGVAKEEPLIATTILETDVKDAAKSDVKDKAEVTKEATKGEKEDKPVEKTEEKSKEKAADAEKTDSKEKELTEEEKEAFAAKAAIQEREKKSRDQFDKARSIELPENIVEEVIKHYESKVKGEIIEGEVTEEDRVNPDIVIEGAGTVDNRVEKKRSLHGKEIAYNIYTGYLSENDVDVLLLSTRDVKTLVQYLVNNDKKEKADAIVKESVKLYEDLKLDEELDRATITESFEGKEVAALIEKMKEDSDFDLDILTGTADSSKIASEDNVKLKAIQMTSNGDFNDGARFVYEMYSRKKGKEGITMDVAKLFVTKLLKLRPYAELENMVINLFDYYEKDKKKEGGYKKAIELAKKLVGTYGRIQKVDKQTSELVFTEVKDAKGVVSNVPVYSYWEEKRVNRFIEKCVSLAMEDGIIEKPKTAANHDKTKEGKKVEPSKENVSNNKKKKGSEAKRAPQQEAKKPVVADTKKADEAKAADSAKATPDVSKTDDKKEETPKKTEPTALRVVVESVCNESQTVYTNTIEGTDYKYVAKVKKNGKTDLNDVVKKTFLNFVGTVLKHNAKAAKNKSLKAKALPKGFEGYKPGDKIILEIMPKNAAA